MKIKNFLVLIGPPGSGKGTQGKLLAPILNYNYLSMGSTLREFSKGDSKESKLVKETIDSGRIIPDTLMKKIFRDTLRQLPKADGLILDGFPRDVDQISILDEAISNHKVDRVKALFIDVPKAKVIQRLTKREGIESRADDNPEVIETRFKEYDQKTHPLVEYFEKQHRLTHINGDQTIEQVHDEIIRKLNHGQIRI
jgi:adenylate kinase